jgi:hypothetical protein
MVIDDGNVRSRRSSSSHASRLLGDMDNRSGGNSRRSSGQGSSIRDHHHSTTSGHRDRDHRSRGRSIDTSDDYHHSSSSGHHTTNTGLLHEEFPLPSAAAATPSNKVVASHIPISALHNRTLIMRLC